MKNKTRRFSPKKVAVFEDKKTAESRVNTGREKK
jgi:hypothetical protein